MTNTLTFTETIEAPLSHVYHTFATKAGWLEWFARKGNGEVGKDRILSLNSEGSGSYVLHFGAFTDQQAVTFTLIDLSTYQTADVRVELQEKNGQVVVTLEAETDHEDFAAKMQDLWEKALTNLKSVVETGKDLTLWNRPFLGVSVADWVSPDMAEEKGLPIDYGFLLNSVFEGLGADNAGLSGHDIIVALDGVDIVDYETLLSVFSQKKAGDTVPVDFYHGDELKHSVITLSKYPIPEIPANAHDLADRFEKFFDKVNEKIDQLLEGQTQVQLDFRPEGGEWSAMEVVAHLMASITDTIEWLGSYIAGRPVSPYTSGLSARIKTLLVLYPTMDELLEAFRQNQQELIVFFEQIPAEVSVRKSSLTNISYNIISDYNYHYKGHLDQLKETLAQAVDVRSI